ncbi:MAG: sigma-54-dependent Fis family transcriptional regulator [Bacteriovoracaceae bacterium]|nr:sigma-54-dependent Fis family transcriptional regulator [Bacteriovoracaceae bacterium]
MLNIAVIEDDKYYRKDIAGHLSRFGKVDEGKSLSDAITLFDARKYDIVFIDLNLSGKMEGLDVIKEAVKRKIPPIVITGYTSEKLVSRAYQLGCKHYYNKLDIQNSFEEQMAPFLRSLVYKQEDDIFSNSFVTRNNILIKNIKLVTEQMFLKNNKVFITGEKGVGKTTIAKFIHKFSTGSMDSFIHVDIPTLENNMIEPLLFGYKKGAFAGASDDFKGLIKQADKGTLFLDEISSLPPSLQKKIIKVVEDKQFYPLGSDQLIKSDFRFITSTNENVEGLIESERLRPDFYFMAKDVELIIPPLRERVEDVRPLVDHYINKSGTSLLVSNDSLKLLENYRWHDNVRELKKLIHSFCNCNTEMISLINLPEHVIENTIPSGQSTPLASVYTKGISNFIKKHGLKKLIETIEIESFKEFYEKNHFHYMNTLEELHISRTAGYRIKANIKKLDKERHLVH